MRMKVLSSYIWNGVMIHPGDEHEANEQEADLLLKMQWAERVPTIGEKITAAISARTGRPKRTYTRRDVTAAQ